MRVSSWRSLGGFICAVAFLLGRPVQAVRPPEQFPLSDFDARVVLLQQPLAESAVRQSAVNVLQQRDHNIEVDFDPMSCTTQSPLISRSLVTLSAVDTTASPNGWINDGDNTTLGNNVDAHLDKNADNAPDTGSRPTGSPFRVFDFGMDLAQEPVTYTNAAVVQIFCWNNWMHDKLYQPGFTEAAGNFQTDNFGRGGLGNDAVQADAQALREPGVFSAQLTAAGVGG